MSVSVTCPHCGRTLNLKNAAALGRDKPCPNCGEVFTLLADDGAADDEFADAPAPPRRSGRAGKKKSGGVPVWAWVVGGVTAGLLVVGGCFAALLIPAIQQARAAARRVEAERDAIAAGAEQAPPPVAAATDAEARRLGERFVAAAESGDANAVAELIDMDALGGHVTAGLGMSERTRREFVDGMRGAKGGLAGQYAAIAEGGGSLKFLGVTDRHEVPGALVRLLPPAGGVNYIVLFPTPGGRVGDMYVFLTGERISASMRRLTGAGLGGSDADRAAMGRLSAMTAAFQRGDGAEALRIYDGLPEGLKGTLAVQVTRMGAAGALDDPAAYAAVMADVDRRFPDDPALDLLKLDAHGDDPAKKAAALRRLDAAVGGDAFLKGLLAETLPLVGATDEALEVAAAAVAAEPDLAQAQFGLLAARIAAGDQAGAAGVLRTLRDEFDLAFEREVLAGLYPAAPAFVDGPEYAAFAAE